MQRIQVSEIRGLVARVLGYCSTDAAVLDYINRAQQRLLESMNSLGTKVRYRVCASDSCVTLPREMENIEAYALCRTPGVVRSNVFEFLEGGPGILRSTDCIGPAAVDQGEFPAYDDVTSGAKKLAVYADRQEETGAIITLQYRDSSGQWYQSSVDGTWIDGEQITLAAPGTYAYTTNNVWPQGFARAYKPVTNGRIRIFEYDVDTNTYRDLAVYQPQETVPVYRRYLLPGLSTLAANSDGTCQKLQVDIVGRMRFQKAYVDNDFLLVCQPDAVRLMCQCLKKEEDNLDVEGRRFEAKAMELLDKQFKHHKGDGEVQPLAWENRGVTGPAVPNMI